MRAPQDEDSIASASIFLSHDVKQPISFPRCISASGVCTFASPTRIEGWAERRETFGCSAEHPLGLHMTRQARRLRGALRPMTRDARLSALHRGGFGLPGPRFRLLGRPPSYNGGQLPCGSVQRAPRTQVVVPGPGSLPHRGASPETILKAERGVAQKCAFWRVSSLQSTFARDSALPL